LTDHSDIDRRPDRFYLPDFCGSTAVFGVVLIAELVAIAMTLARQTSWEFFYDDLAKTSFLLIWNALSIGAVLCVLRKWLSQFSTSKGSLVTFFIIIGVIAIVSEAVYLIGTIYQPQGIDLQSTAWFPDNHWYFLSRNILVGSILSGLALRYFYVSYQWQRNVESMARTRIEALQARIRPHFLFNSMNTIAALTRSNPAAAESAVEDLADLFRASLADSNRLVNLEQEFEVTRVYQRMEEQRLGDRLIVDWQIADLPGRAKIPSLTLQPLLENAIYHGIEMLSEQGKVEIEGRLKGDMIYLSVRNPLPPIGSGSEHGNKIALDNIAERLSLAFGPRARVSRAVDATHYQVTIAIPYEA
jgi:two-component system sensor histidine kinase AlgZ